MNMRLFVGGLAAVLCLASAHGAETRPPLGPPNSSRSAGAVDGPSVAPPTRQTTSTLIYMPIPPCRAFYSPTAVVAGSTTAFKVTGSGSLAGQGGPVAGCGVPDYAKAVSINLSAVNPTANGSFKAFATGTATPPTTVLNYRASINETGGATVALGSAGQMSVLSTSRARIIGDITGYYALPLHGMIDIAGGIYSGSPAFIDATLVSTGTYLLTVDRDVSYCTLAVVAYNYGNLAQGALFNGNQVTIYVSKLVNGALRTTNDYVYVTITC